uniref:Uncharacterized protein n=1 Tax=Arion vulgaris TaxID=1028688 RepID=A0A0B7BF65_9EUPU
MASLTEERYWLHVFLFTLVQQFMVAEFVRMVTTTWGSGTVYFNIFLVRSHTTACYIRMQFGEQNAVCRSVQCDLWYTHLLFPGWSQYAILVSFVLTLALTVSYESLIATSPYSRAFMR